MFKRRFSFILTVLLLAVGIVPAYASADPLDEWHSRITSLPNVYALDGIVYGNGTFVAVGSQGTILTSHDGTVWERQRSGTSASLEDIAYGNGLFVAIGRYDNEVAVLTSTDGKTWTNRPVPKVPPYGSTEQHSITYKNNQFMIAGMYRVFPYDPQVHHGVVRVSKDGINWSENISLSNWGGNPTTWYGWLESITYGNGRYVEVGGGKIQTSNALTGAERKISEFGPYSDNNLVDVRFDNGIFIVVGNLGGLVTSIDGMTWTIRRFGTSDGFKGLSSIGYGNGTHIVVGHAGSILTSKDGTSWTTRTSSTTKGLRDIAYGNGTFVVVGESGAILQSSPLTPVPDKTPPITKYAVTPIWATVEGVKYIKGYTITLTATDDLSGVKQTYYRIKDGAWKVYTAPFALSGEGSTSLDFYSEDNAGNREAMQ